MGQRTFNGLISPRSGIYIVYAVCSKSCIGFDSKHCSLFQTSLLTPVSSVDRLPVADAFEVNMASCLNDVCGLLANICNAPMGLGTMVGSPLGAVSWEEHTE